MALNIEFVRKEPITDMKNQPNPSCLLLIISRTQTYAKQNCVDSIRLTLIFDERHEEFSIPKTSKFLDESANKSVFKLLKKRE